MMIRNVLNSQIPAYVVQILDECVNGITLADPKQDDTPIVFVNKAFEQLTGYKNEEIMGRNCRFLQRFDRGQEGRYAIAEAIKTRSSVQVTLKNYRKNGELFYNRLKIMPLYDDDGELIYFLGLQYDITYFVNTANEIERLTSLIKGSALSAT